MIFKEYFKLANGVDIPKLGLGTWMINDENVSEAILAAVKTGYRHFDTAQAYGNERGVGEAVRKCGIPREDLFVTTKLDAFIKDYEGALDAIEGSLEKMGIDYLDLMLIHSPQPWNKFGEDDRFFEANREAWKALEDNYKAGKIRSIGVSNFQKADLDNILENCTVKPMVNQILAHVSNTPFELIEYTKSKGLLVEAYSPVAHGEIFKNKEVAEMAKKYGVSVSQLCIRYCLQLDMLPLPKTANPEHMKENAGVNFEILEEDMEALKNIDQINDYGEFSKFPVYGKKGKA